MTIKQVEERLGIPKATIRFYEKEGLVQPRRSENGYRDYSEEDVEILRRIIIFRKLGMSVEMIADLQDRTATLQDTLERNLEQLQQQMEELNGAMTICRELKNRAVQLETFDDGFWWEQIHREEAKGLRFMDLAKDLAAFYGEHAEEELGLRKRGEKGPVHWGKILCFGGIAAAAFCLVVVLVLKNSVWEALETLVSVTLIEGIIIFPRYFLRKKSAAAEKRYEKAVTTIAGVIFCGMVLLWVWVISSLNS